MHNLSQLYMYCTAMDLYFLRDFDQFGPIALITDHSIIQVMCEWVHLSTHDEIWMVSHYINWSLNEMHNIL